MKFLTDGEALFSWLSVPGHLCGWAELVHGGVTATVLDEIMGWAAVYLSKSMVMTKSISLDFIKPVYVGRELRAEARLAGKSGGREVVIDGLLFDDEETICARAKGNFAVLTPEFAARLGMLSKNISDFLDLMSSC